MLVKTKLTTWWLAVAGAAWSLLVSCTAPGGPGSVTDPNFFGFPGDAAAPAGPGNGGGGEPVAARCVPVEAERLPARSSVMSETAEATMAPTMFTADLFNLFKSHCGGCHAETSLGNWQVTGDNFGERITPEVLSTIKSDDSAKFMPPPAAGGVPYSQRPAEDPVVELVGLLEHWMNEGKPDFLFNLPAAEMPVGPRYVLSPAIGQGMTNIGNCVPTEALVGVELEAMDALDAKFAATTELPLTLAETDLTTWNGETLARSRVIAFAPTYPLWSDNAAKIRHVRVPRGQTVAFDKGSQSFSIPPNTRFYKTFLKKVIDIDGNESYRKIETRLIVARADKQNPDGTAESTALFGTYLWNEEETEATLLRDPLRNGQPFRDRLITYQRNERRHAEILASMPSNPQFELEDVEENKAVLRKYAVPSAERCVQCHMGSSGANFILGFTPLQIARRPLGEGGVIEPTSADELNQLQRFIEYGIISGIAAQSDVVPLEAAQGDRKPRTEQELVAQGYLLGGCANCHNPRGFPSIKSPELKDALNFLPGPEGGIFEFPLDRTSPLRRRGINQDVPVPYITPSLREYPVAQHSNDNWVRKWFDCSFTPVWNKCKLTGARIVHVEAPWRSLIYRNVDTPFMYADDFVVFPHMPMHVPGFDCRLPRIMGDWMVSIPAVRKHPEIHEDFVPGYGNKYDDEPQPYLEVKPNDPGYAKAVAAAQKRLEQYHKGGRYDFCPDDLDVVDREVLKDEYKLVPPAEDIFDEDDATVLEMPNLRVPTRTHWVVTDLTEAAGDWAPRRPDWRDVLVERKVVLPKGTPAERIEEQQTVVNALKEVRISEELRQYALTPIPYALWKEKPGCDFKDVKKASDFPGDARPAWMDRARPPATAPVYMQSPGEAVYTGICFNCHGPKADSQGLLAEALSLMTGGNARVANFRDGLFGTAAEPGSNRQRVFAMAPKPVEDMAGTYMAWMALGGTLRQLPADLLNIVASTRILGELRNTSNISQVGSPNMLRLGQDLCSHVLPAHTNVSRFTLDLQSYPVAWGRNTGLIDTNGDAEMWLRLCSLGNRPVVRVPYVEWKEGEPLKLEVRPIDSHFWGDSYGAAPVLNHKGQIENGIKPDNVFPVCIRKPTDPAELAIAEKVLAANPVGGAGGAIIPYCPEAILGEQLEVVIDAESRHQYVDARAWATRGAANAGLAVFLYLDQMVRGNVQPTPAYDKCEERKSAP